METLAEIAYNIIAPIFVIVAASAGAARLFHIDAGGLSRVVVYLFTPCLIFNGIAGSDLSADEGTQLVTVAAVSSLLVAGAAWIVARVARFDERLSAAFVLSSTLINAGNYGLPLNRFAFGAAGEERALIFWVTTVLVSYTLGVYLASRSRDSARQALRNVFSVPLPYAAAAGLLANAGQVDLPLPLQRSVELLSDATIPGMLAVLGIQLSQATIRGRLRPIALASGIRLVIAPLIALGLAMAFGLSGLTRQVSIVQAAMPTAVVTGVLATEFGADAEFVTATILVSTLASVATLSVLLSLLM